MGSRGVRERRGARLLWCGWGTNRKYKRYHFCSVRNTTFSNTWSILSLKDSLWITEIHILLWFGACRCPVYKEKKKRASSSFTVKFYVVPFCPWNYTYSFIPRRILSNEWCISNQNMYRNSNLNLFNFLCKVLNVKIFSSGLNWF